MLVRNLDYRKAYENDIKDKFKKDEKFNKYKRNKGY